jgi:quercetin dioxygenase-like cupin family protein
MSGYAALHPEEGQAFWHFGGLLVLKLTGSDTDGQLALAEELMPRGCEAYMHRHSRDAETFFMLDGEVTFTLGEERFLATSGAVVHVPRGVPHAFRVESETARFLVFQTPAGLERAFPLLSPPAEALTLPPASMGRPTVERMREVGAEFGTEILE